MDFRLSEEQEALRRAAEEFARKEFNSELVNKLKSAIEYPWEMLKKAARLGFIGLHFPERFGGQGYGLLEKVLVIESFCRKDPNLGTALSLSDIGSRWILDGGSDEQRERFLPSIAKGEAVLSAGLSLTTDMGVKDLCVRVAWRGDTVILSGKEPFVINAGLARQTVVLGEIDPGKRRGFIIEENRHGVVLEESEPKMGLPFVPVLGIRFQDVAISNSDFLPSVEHKSRAALKIEITAQSLGMARGAFERALEYAGKREAFGRRIIEFQALNHKLADLETRLEASKWLIYHAAWELDRGDTDPKLAAMAKLHGNMMVTEIIKEAIQTLGGYGFLKEYGLERYYLDAWFTELCGGTAEDQKDEIAKIWLKKN